MLQKYRLALVVSTAVFCAAGAYAVAAAIRRADHETTTYVFVGCAASLWIYFLILLGFGQQDRMLPFFGIYRTNLRNDRVFRTTAAGVGSIVLIVFAIISAIRHG
jgi:hypothetical protein